jgi:hypothetical protein
VKRAEWPALATTNAGWLRHVNRAVSLLIVVVLLTLLFRAGRDILAEGERMALDLAEQNLENLGPGPALGDTARGAAGRAVA